MPQQSLTATVWLQVMSRMPIGVQWIVHDVLSLHVRIMRAVSRYDL